MDRKVIFFGIAIIGLLAMLFALDYWNITIQQKRSGTVLLYEMGLTGISTENTEMLRPIIKEYYDSYYKDVYPTYADFINKIIVSPYSLLHKKKVHLLGNRKGFNYGALYLRFFVVRAYYSSELLSKSTQNYIDNSLANDDERIWYGGETRDGKNVTAVLPITIGQLIKDLKENNQSGHSN